MTADSLEHVEFIFRGSSPNFNRMGESAAHSEERADIRMGIITIIITVSDIVCTVVDLTDGGDLFLHLGYWRVVFKVRNKLTGDNQGNFIYISRIRRDIIRVIIRRDPLFFVVRGEVCDVGVCVFGLNTIVSLNQLDGGAIGE